MNSKLSSLKNVKDMICDGVFGSALSNNDVSVFYAFSDTIML